MSRKLNLYRAARWAATLVLTVVGMYTAQAQYLYNQPITVTNHEGAKVERWQLAIYINTAALVTLGHMQADGRDIRFSKDCAGTQLLDYFIDSGMNTAKTKIWVKMDTLYPNASRVIYMLYGNPTATAASTYNTFNGPYSATNYVKPPSTNTVSDCQRSMKFSAKRDIIVSGFGKYTPDGTTRWVTLFDYSSQAKLEQIQVSGTAGNYSFNNLSKHIWLEANKDYVLALHNGSGDMYYYGAAAQSSQYINYGDMRYCNSCNQNTFPTTVLTNNMYGVPDFMYYTVDTNNITKEPTYVLSGSGNGGNAEVTFDALPVHVCPTDHQAFIAYTNTKGDPKTYDLKWTASAKTAGFTDVTGDNFTMSPLAIDIPPGVTTGSYMGTFTPINNCGKGKPVTIEIIVGAPIAIGAANQPKDTTVCPGEPSGFEVLATGPGLLYQWQVNNGTGWTNLVNNADYTDVNTPKLKVLNSKNGFNGHQYRCMVTSNCATALPSAAGKLNVNVDPMVVTDPKDVVANPGQTVTFEVVNAGNAKYQWQVAVPGTAFVNVNDGGNYQGVKTNKITVNNVSVAQNNYEFRVLLYNAGICTSPGDTSNIAILSVIPPQSVNDLGNESIVKVYPNPVTGNELYIAPAKGQAGQLTYTISDKLGKVVAEGEVAPTGNTKVDVSHLAAGLYIVDIAGNKGQSIGKIKFSKL